MENLKMYTPEEQQEAIITYDKLIVKVNGEERMTIVKGDKVTLVGEFVISSNGDLDYGTKLRQFIFVTDRYVSSIHESFVKIVPKEKLSLGDYVRITWHGFALSNEYVVSYSPQKHYFLQRISVDTFAFSQNQTPEELLNDLRESSIVASYEILPKEDYKLTVTER
jgi:hypothetical protein